METPVPARAQDILREATSQVERRLPRGWTLDLIEQVDLGSARVDGVLRVRAPDGTEAPLLVEAKRQMASRDVADAMQQLTSIANESRLSQASPMIVTRYLSPSVRDRLQRSGIAYADATGNVHIALSRPALFLRDTGADRDPWRGPGRPRGTLQGPPAARVVRALVDYAPPLTVLDLVRLSGASVGATYRVVDFLEREALIDRQHGSPIQRVHWRQLIERWSGDYGFQRSNAVRAYLEPRGLTHLLESMRSVRNLKYVLTGSVAAQRFAPYAPPRLAAIYVDDVEAASKRWNLRAVESGSNVLVAAAAYDVVFERSRYIDGLQIAAPSQIAVDLLTGPGRSAAEAQALLDWMEVHEHDWRLRAPDSGAKRTP
jgi:hypothetical protein